MKDIKNGKIKKKLARSRKNYKKIMAFINFKIKTGLEDLENAPAPASGTQSTHAVTVHSSGPPQKEGS